MSSSTYDAVIQKWSDFYNIPFALLKAVVAQESSFVNGQTRYEPKINDTSYGLMQILSKTADWVTNMFGIPYSGAGDLQDPEKNVQIGAAYMKYLLDKYNGDTGKALAAYNAGKPYQTKSGTFVNQGYVDSVMNWFRKFTPVQSDSGGASPSGSTSTIPDGSENGGINWSIMAWIGAGFLGVILLRRVL